MAGNDEDQINNVQRLYDPKLINIFGTKLQDRYLEIITLLSLKGYIVDSPDRELRERGKSVVQEFCGDSLDIEGIVTSVRYLRQARPDDILEVDSFCFEAACVVYNEVSREREHIPAILDRNPLVLGETCVLGAVDVLEQAVRREMMEINPSGCPGDGKQYVGYKGGELITGLKKRWQDSFFGIN